MNSSGHKNNLHRKEKAGERMMAQTPANCVAFPMTFGCEHRPQRKTQSSLGPVGFKKLVRPPVPLPTQVYPRECFKLANFLQRDDNIQARQLVA
jgi:hypothetical protein